MKHLKKFNESRVVGFKYNKPTEQYSIRFNVLSNDNVLRMIRNFLDDMDVVHGHVTGGNSSHNSYHVDITVYNEREVDTIMNDLSLKMLVRGQKLDDITKSKK